MPPVECAPETLVWDTETRKYSELDTGAEETRIDIEQLVIE